MPIFGFASFARRSSPPCPRSVFGEGQLKSPCRLGSDLSPTHSWSDGRDGSPTHTGVCVTSKRELSAPAALSLHIDFIQHLLDIGNVLRQLFRLLALGGRFHFPLQCEHAILGVETDIFVQTFGDQDGLVVLLDAIIQVGGDRPWPATPVPQAQRLPIHYDPISGVGFGYIGGLLLRILGMHFAVQRDRIFVSIFLDIYVFQVGLLQSSLDRVFIAPLVLLRARAG